MYRSKLWTMRLFAGFGTAEDTNARFKELLRSGSDGLSVAFDLPTLMGRDSDDPRCEGEVGKCGVAVDTLADVEDLFSGIDLGSVTTSMTINSPAPILLAMYVAAAAKTGVERSKLGGTLQNDMLKEYQAQKEYVFPPRPSVRLVTDVIEFCQAEMPRFHPVSVSGYHIREAGSTAVQELAFTLANGFAYVEAAMDRGLGVDDFAPRLSFFFNAHVDFFEEIAKYRAARRIWARWMSERYGAKSPVRCSCVFIHRPPGCRSPRSNPRSTSSAPQSRRSQACSVELRAFTRTRWTRCSPFRPNERRGSRSGPSRSSRDETGVTTVADPLGGSWFVESLTDEMERLAEETFSTLDTWGNGSMLEGVLEGIERRWFQSEIAEAAYDLERRISSGRRVVVGVNAFTEGNNDPQPPILRIGREVEELQRKRLASVRQARSETDVAAALADLEKLAHGDGNLMPPILRAVEAYATVGEIIDSLARVFGRFTEVAAL